MATTTGLESQPVSRSFYLRYSVLFVLVAFGGFLPTYWMPLATGHFHAPPIIHIHGLLFFGWTLFYFVQTYLVASGRRPLHRNWGMAGIALFSVMMCTIVMATVASMKLADAQGFGDGERRFVAVSLTAIPLLVALFALAIGNVGRPEVHKRLMLLIMASMMGPAIARLFVAALAQPGAGAPPPVFSLLPLFVADLMLIPALVSDWRKLGRIHPVYAWGLPIAIAQQVLAVPLAATASWMATARALEGLGG